MVSFNSNHFTCKSQILLLLVCLIYSHQWFLSYCHGYQTFGFDIHHRYSDKVRGILSSDDLPEIGSVEYYAAMAHRDMYFRGRGLAQDDDDHTQLLTFSGRNGTLRLPAFGFLHYAIVSMGTPSLSFIVALDTGSHLFWVPCNCSSCVRALVKRSGKEIPFNIYNPKSSSTSKKVPCNSSLCELQNSCSRPSNQCPYQVLYVSNDTSTSGVLVEDVLHLTPDSGKPQDIDARITFGCGQVQLGSLLEGAAPNGLFGLGMDKTAVPSMLSKAGLVADSFSLCFGENGVGRISFGDKGSPDQNETPFDVRKLHPAYNISVTQIRVDTNVTDVEFGAAFDSGTSFTYLNDPAYTVLSESFNSQVVDERLPSDPNIRFEYCYRVSSDKNGTLRPTVKLTMKGEKLFTVMDATTVIFDGVGSRYCLAILKSPNVNIIGQNFMSGLRIVFDREKMILGWKESNCDEIKATNKPKVSNTSQVTPAPAVQPGGASRTAGNSSTASPFSVGKPPRSYLIATSILILVLPILLII